MKVCFLTCHFPPLARTFRRYQFARYLAEAGCDVEIVAHGNVSKALGAFVDDPDTLPQSSDIPVHRPRAIPWYLTGELLFRGGLVPCPHINWLRPAASAVACVASTSEDVICSLYPPITDHLAAAMAANRTGAKLVLDFRDEYRDLSSGLQSAWAQWCEKWVIQRAALVSVATQEVADNLIDRYGLNSEDVLVTPNGFWRMPESTPPHRDCDKVQIVYIGSITAAQGLEVIFDAVEMIQRHHPEKIRRFELTIYGPDNYYRRNRLARRFNGAIKYGGYLNAGEVSARLAASDVCYLSLASSDYAYAIPGKLYEYIAHARPVFAVLPEGSAQRLIEQEDFGLVADPHSPDDVARKLVAMLDSNLRARLYRNLVRQRHKYAAAPNFKALGKRILKLQ